GGDGDLLARLVLGAQRLAKPALVVSNQVRGGGQDVRGGAVVALEADDSGTGKVVLEAQDVVDLRPAPAVDRLVVVADAADVFESPRRRRYLTGLVITGSRRLPRAGALPEQAQPEILRDVGVLIFVHQDVFEPALVLPQHVGLLAEQPDAFEQQVAE